MKTQSLTMGLALLVAAFMWGCQADQTSLVGPAEVGPQFLKPNCAVDDSHPSCKDDGDGGSKTAEVEPTAGITAPADQRIKKEADGKKKLNVNGVLTDVTIALGTNANCNPPLEVDGLALDRKFVMVIDRKGGTGEIRVKWPPEAITQELFLVDAAVAENPAFVSHPTDATFTLTGGQVTVKDRPSGATCTFANGATVMVDVRP